MKTVSIDGSPNMSSGLVEAWENPPHVEFEARNGFSLYNAFTHAMKRQSPARQVEGFVALNKVLLPQAA